MANSIADQRPIAVLLEIETGNHNPENCFRGLERQFTLSVKADDVRDQDPRATAARIFEALAAHRSKARAGGFEIKTVATHTWQPWRDTIGSEVQQPFSALVESMGMRYVELGQERCNEEFKELLDSELDCTVS